MRYHELDWLRVGLIIAVFLHHVAMPFNGDGFLIMNHESSKLLDDIMVYFEQFRLPLLFLIAGAGSVLFLSAKTAAEFAKRRIMRLLLPLLFAIVVIVPPQNYIKHIDEYDSYLSAWPTLASQFESHHLWFIEYLLVFAMFSWPIYYLLQHKSTQLLLSLLAKWAAKGRLLWVAALLVTLNVSLKIYFPSSDHQMSNLSSSLFYGFFYLMGMVMVSQGEIWRSLAQYRRFNGYALLVATLLFYGYYYSPDLSDYLPIGVRWGIWWAVTSLVSWAATLTLLGYAQHYLSHTHRWLSRCNQMIYPFYIFHQTVIVMVGYYVIQWQTTIAIKLLSLLFIALFLTVALCAGLVYPFNFMRLLFGVRSKQSSALKPNG